MKRIHFPVFLCLAISCIRCTGPESKTTRKPVTSPPIVAGVFEGYGGAQTCIWETVAAVELDPGMKARIINSSHIANNVLDSIDAIIIPGGGGKRQYMNLGSLNHQRIKDFVAKGHGAVGICAGAYLFSNTPGYTCLALNGEQAIDLEHDNRGHGLSKFTLTDEGKDLFPELAERDTCYAIYYEGPVFIKNVHDSIRNTTLALMESDVHEEGDAPANMTNGKPFFLTNSYGKGRVFCSIAHPEATPGMMWMIPRMVRWTLGKPIIPYKETVVLPSLFNRELLMNATGLKQEAAYFQTLATGSEPEKLAALDWLETHHSWDAKRWVQGLLYDASAQVRVRAARYIADTHYIHYLPDLRSACRSETEHAVRIQLKEQLDKLEALLP